MNPPDPSRADLDPIVAEAVGRALRRLQRRGRVAADPADDPAMTNLVLAELATMAWEWRRAASLGYVQARPSAPPAIAPKPAPPSIDVVRP